MVRKQAHQPRRGTNALIYLSNLKPFFSLLLSAGELAGWLVGWKVNKQAAFEDLLLIN